MGEINTNALWAILFDEEAIALVDPGGQPGPFEVAALPALTAVEL